MKFSCHTFISDSYPLRQLRMRIGSDLGFKEQALGCRQTIVLTRL